MSSFLSNTVYLRENHNNNENNNNVLVDAAAWCMMQVDASHEPCFLLLLCIALSWIINFRNLVSRHYQLTKFSAVIVT